MPSPGKTFWDTKLWGRLELLVLQICITFLVFTYKHKYTKFVFHFLTSLFKKRASQVALAVKYLPATETQEMWVWSLDWEDPLEESMATRSSVLAWRTPWTEEPGRLQSMESQLKWLSTKHAQCIKKQRHHFTNKDLRSESYGFSSSHVWMWELNCKEGWVLKNWYFWFMVLEKTLETPLDCKEIKSVNPKISQSWIFIGRADAETPIFWSPDVKSWLIEKDPDDGKDWEQEEWATEDEIFRWHHRLNGHEFEQTLGDGEGQGELVCCSPWGHKDLDTT